MKREFEFQNPDNIVKTYRLILQDGFEPKQLPCRDEWLAALRSGAFEQGVGNLSRDNKDCCLGVFCKLLKLPSRPTADYGTWEFYSPCGTAVGSTKVFPQGTPQHAVFDGHGVFPAGAYIEYMTDGGTDNVTTLTGCNDQLRLSFMQIAVLIEYLWIQPPCTNSIPSSGAPS